MTMQRPAVTYQDHWKSEGYDTMDVRPVTPVLGAEAWRGSQCDAFGQATG